MSSESSSSSSKTIVEWNPDRTLQFIDICNERIDTRPGRVSSWYSEIANAFNEVTDLCYTASHMKNKWDNLKCSWTVWDLLLQREGGEWDMQRDTVTASDD